MNAQQTTPRTARWSVRRRAAFSLAEILVVIGILGILLSLMLPAVQSAREAGRRTQCQNNLREIAIALHAHDDLHGYLPPRPASHPNDPNKALHWAALILAQLDRATLWSVTQHACTVDAVSHHNPPHVGHVTIVREYVCPTDSRLMRPLPVAGYEAAAFTSYVGVAGSPKGGTLLVDPGGGTSLIPAPGMLVYHDQDSSLAAVTDGLSQTLMVGERPPPVSLEAGRWYSRYLYGGPNPGPDGILHIPAAGYLGDDPCASSEAGFGPGRLENPCDRHHFWSLHPGGANFAFGDGSIHFMNYSAAPIMHALATRSRGETVELP